MSSLFPVLSASASGIGAYSLEAAAVGDNLANLNTVRPTTEPAYQARRVLVRPAVATPGVSELGQGVVVTGAEFSSPEGQLSYQPESPYADEQGYVRAPDMEITTQFERLIVAQRALQANVSAFARGREMYQQVLSLGSQR